ncbi:ATP-binding protein [Arcicella sp. LKC2W]|uniref:ATP-binding protein n=1 Tax=Arcicella sp. LKC2W TaxID=2984198 RepID=UPI002B200D42|nr:ATP-binding protein [Arcicella sp. LKC2W]MEA5461246.1 ATP-binding protein [Arcicella sp. LKC2W]
MKVKELYIKKYHQFEDFKLDLTYPQGHEKAGQPLDKVCFIGQSGTGKTSLLEFIQKFIRAFFLFGYNDEQLLEVSQDEIGSRIIFITPHTEQEMFFSATEEKTFDVILTRSEIETDIKLKRHNIQKVIQNYLPSTKVVSIYYPVNFTNNIQPNQSALTEYLIDNIIELNFIDFGSLGFEITWYNINHKITEYRETQIQKSLAISQITNKTGFKSEEILEAAKKYQEWEQNNPNPLQDLADKVLDRVLNKFNLRVRTRLDFERIEDVKTIKIETLDGQEVPYDFQSTGTRQVFLSMLPLYTLKPNRTAIFFDEPERSLYPDIQKEIVDIYTSLTTDCQFFYATHSPIIASSFEPWEIVELKFNPKTGTVFQELYYEGERHVDNYTINPQYLRWDDILQRVFDLDSEGNEKRVKALMKLATLESKLKKNNITPEEREKLWQEYLKLSKLTGWTTRITNEKN